MTQIYAGERQSGKTTMLIEKSAETGAIIVAPTLKMARYIQDIAKKMGKEIPNPISALYFIHIISNENIRKHKKFLIDEVQMVLDQMNVEIATADNDCVKRVTHNEVWYKPSEKLPEEGELVILAIKDK